MIRKCEPAILFPFLSLVLAISCVSWYTNFIWNNAAANPQTGKYFKWIWIWKVLQLFADEQTNIFHYFFTLCNLFLTGFLLCCFSYKLVCLPSYGKYGCTGKSSKEKRFKEMNNKIFTLGQKLKTSPSEVFLIFFSIGRERREEVFWNKPKPNWL